MKKNFTEIVFILDESGSMGHLVQDTIGGFNSLINKQKNEEGDAVVTTIFFNTASKVLHDSAHIAEVEKMAEKHYCPSDCTALLDTVGDAISNVKKGEDLKISSAWRKDADEFWRSRK